MKKLILGIIIALFTQTIILSQPCLPYGITFTNQTQIDNFQTNYPNCSEIEGGVEIGEYGYSTNITNLDGLSVLTTIEGELDISFNPALTSFSGLDNLYTKNKSKFKYYENEKKPNRSSFFGRSRIYSGPEIQFSRSNS